MVCMINQMISGTPNSPQQKSRFPREARFLRPLFFDTSDRSAGIDHLYDEYWCCCRCQSGNSLTNNVCVNNTCGEKRCIGCIFGLSYLDKNGLEDSMDICYYDGDEIGVLDNKGYHYDYHQCVLTEGCMVDSRFRDFLPLLLIYPTIIWTPRISFWFFYLYLDSQRCNSALREVLPTYAEFCTSIRVTFQF